MMTSVSADLQATLALLTERGWRQGAYSGVRGAHDLVGAIGVVAGIRTRGVIMACARQLVDPGHDPLRALIDWNDDHETEWADVESLLIRAIAEQEAPGLALDMWADEYRLTYGRFYL
jgi:hypothetical protein